MLNLLEIFFTSMILDLLKNILSEKKNYFSDEIVVIFLYRSEKSVWDVHVEDQMKLVLID